MPFQQHEQQPSAPNQATQPITVELLSDFWFLGLAIVAIVAYLVKLELGVKENRTRIEEVADETLPEIRNSMNSLEARNDTRMRDMHSSISAEIHTCFSTQQGFIAAQGELILEKLNSRDTAIASLKEQLNRQGQDIREIEGHLKYQDHHRKPN